MLMVEEIRSLGFWLICWCCNEHTKRILLYNQSSSLPSLTFVWVEAVLSPQSPEKMIAINGIPLQAVTTIEAYDIRVVCV